MRSPQETLEEASSYELNYEAEKTRRPPGLREEDMEEMYWVALKGRPSGIARLEKMVKRFPSVPALWNYLAVAHRVANNEKKARKVERQMFEQHPDYLFAKLAEARHRFENGRSESVPEVLGESLTLREVLGQNETAHHSDWKNFYATIADWHLEEGRLDHATSLLEALRRAPETEREVSVLQRKLTFANFKEFQKRMEREQKHRVQVDQGEVPRMRDRSPKPEGLSPEVEALYDHGIRMPEEKIRAVLELAREQAIEELRVVLRDATENGPHFHHFREEYDEDTLEFGPHALWLLSELKAVEAVPDVLEFLSQHRDVLEELFGDIVPCQSLFGFIDGDLSAPAEWMKRPGLSTIGRSAMSEAIVNAAALRPELRDAALAFLREVFEAMRDGEPGDGVLDTSLVSQMVGDAIELRAVELEDVLRELYAQKRVEETFVGTLEDVLEELASSEEPEVPEVPDMIEFYRCLPSGIDGADEEDSEDAVDFGEDFEDSSDPFESALTAWAPPDAGQDPATPTMGKVGRNDPCPCGSGKKYKKCCLS